MVAVTDDNGAATARLSQRGVKTVATATPRGIDTSDETSGAPLFVMLMMSDDDGMAVGIRRNESFKFCNYRFEYR